MKVPVILAACSLLLGCASGGSVNMNNPVLDAAVNVPLALKQTEKEANTNCDEKMGEAKAKCINQVAQIKRSINKHRKSGGTD